MANRTQSRNQEPAFSLVPVEQRLVAAEPAFRQLATAAGRGVDYHREINFALSKVKESQQLQRCNVESFSEAFENLASMGLSLNPNLGQAALIPRWNSKRKCMWVTAQPMYRGFIALATGGPKIKNVWGAVVLQGDDIKVILGSHPRVEHAPKIGRPKGESLPSCSNVLGAYVCAEVFGSNEIHTTWMDIDDILQVAERSESYNPKPREKNGQQFTPEPSGPWITDFGQMCVKTVFRRGWKTWPGIDTKEYEPLQNAVRADTYAEIMDHEAKATKEEEVSTTTLVITADQSKELNEMCVKKRLRPQTVLKAYAVDSFDAIPADKFAEIKSRISSFGNKA